MFGRNAFLLDVIYICIEKAKIIFSNSSEFVELFVWFVNFSLFVFKGFFYVLYVMLCSYLQLFWFRYLPKFRSLRISQFRHFYCNILPICPNLWRSSVTLTSFIGSLSFRMLPSCIGFRFLGRSFFTFSTFSSVIAQDDSISSLLLFCRRPFGRSTEFFTWLT